MNCYLVVYYQNINNYENIQIFYVLLIHENICMMKYKFQIFNVYYNHNEFLYFHVL